MTASGSSSLIPRLVVHKAEVQKIFHPDHYHRHNNRNNPSASNSNSNNSEALQGATTATETAGFGADDASLSIHQDTTDLSVANGSMSVFSIDNTTITATATITHHSNSNNEDESVIFLRGAMIPDVTAIRNRVRQLGLELPEHMRTAPIILQRIATELPISLANRAIELPSNLFHVATTDIQTTIISLAEGVEGTLEAIVQISSDVAREVVELPHKASFEWKQLIWVLFLLVLAPVVIFGVIFFIPMNSVNDGIKNNRAFVYGTLTFYQMLTIAPWIETCNFAMPKAKIPFRARFITMVLVMIMAKILDALLVEGVFGMNIFPIPFSILISGLLGFAAVVPALHYLTTKREKADFGRMQRVLRAYWVSLIIVIAWAVGVHRLSGHSWWQSGVIILYGPLRFVCKILIAAPVTTDHNPHRWIQLNLVVDIIFTRVQVATFPFIDSYVTLLMLFSTEVLTLAWRYYSGVDRLALWWSAIWMTPEEDNSQGPTSFFRRASGITKGCLRAPIPLVAELNFCMRSKEFEPSRIVRTLTGDTISCESVKEVPRSSSLVLCASTDDIPTMSEPENETDTAHTSIDIEKACDAADEQMSHSFEENNSTISKQHSIGSSARVYASGIQKYGIQILQTSDVINESASQRSLVMDDEAESVVSKANTDIASAAHQNDERIAPDFDAFRSFHSLCSRSTVLLEEHWEQRPLYHVVDSTGANVISIIVRVNQQLSVAMVRGLPSLNHLNDSFQISDEHWMKAQIFGWTFIILMLLLLALLGCVFFRRMKHSDEKKLSLSRVMSYLFKDHFWFFFLWLVSTGAFVCASMVNHFGADFSMRFEWLSCPEQIAWPGCPAAS